MDNLTKLEQIEKSMRLYRLTGDIEHYKDVERIVNYEGCDD